jgi:hypothetical protein
MAAGRILERGYGKPRLNTTDAGQTGELAKMDFLKN